MSTDSKMTREIVLETLGDPTPCSREHAREVYAAVEATYDEVERLRAFAQALFREMDWPEGGDLDGFQFQELATKHGLLEEKEMAERCGEACQCADYDDPPFVCYRKTKLLTGDAAIERERQ